MGEHDGQSGTEQRICSMKYLHFRCVRLRQKGGMQQNTPLERGLFRRIPMVDRPTVGQREKRPEGARNCTGNATGVSYLTKGKETLRKL